MLKRISDTVLITYVLSYIYLYFHQLKTSIKRHIIIVLHITSVVDNGKPSGLWPNKGNRPIKFQR